MRQTCKCGKVFFAPISLNKCGRCRDFGHGTAGWLIELILVRQALIQVLANHLQNQRKE